MTEEEAKKIKEWMMEKDMVEELWSYDCQYLSEIRMKMTHLKQIMIWKVNL